MKRKNKAKKKNTSLDKMLQNSQTLLSLRRCSCSHSLNGEEEKRAAKKSVLEPLSVQLSSIQSLSHV